MRLGYWKDGEFISFQATWAMADDLALLLMEVEDGIRG